MRILVDRNLVPQTIADAGSSDQGIADNSGAAWRMLQSKNTIEACLTDRSLEWIYQLYESQTNSVHSAQKIKRQIKLTFEILPVAFRMLYYAGKSAIDNLEYAVDVECARSNQVWAILTRQPQNYSGARLPEVSLKTLTPQTLRKYLAREADLPLLLLGGLADLLLLEALLTRRSLLPSLPARPPVVPLTRWLAAMYGQGWLPEAELGLPEAEYNRVRERRSQAPVRGKLLTFNDPELQLALLLRVSPYSETELEARVMLRTIDRATVLPSELELRLLDQQGNLYPIEYYPSSSAQIEFPIIGEIGEQFSLEFRLQNSRLVEEFVF